ncbi:UDP-3-O-acylglucosamine N-acyltransferase, partial [Striga asiatica]
MGLPEVGPLSCEFFFNFHRNFEGPFSNLFAILLGADANGFSNVSLIMVVGFGAFAILEMLVFSIFEKWGIDEDDEFEEKVLLNSILFLELHKKRKLKKMTKRKQNLK